MKSPNDFCKRNLILMSYNNKVSITVFEKLYVSIQTNKLSDNKNVLKNIQSNAQAGVLVQFNLIYDRQTLLMYMNYARYRGITGSNAQTSECTIFWQHKRQEQSTATEVNHFSVESGINNYQSLFQSNFCKQQQQQTTHYTLCPTNYFIW